MSSVDDKSNSTSPSLSRSPSFSYASSISSSSAEGSVKSKKLGAMVFDAEAYLQYHKASVEERAKLGAGRSPLMRNLYRFWRDFLVDYWNAPMYRSFIRYAEEDASAGALYGLERLFRYFHFTLSKRYSTEVYHDFEKLAHKYADYMSFWQGLQRLLDLLLTSFKGRAPRGSQLDPRTEALLHAHRQAVKEAQRQAQAQGRAAQGGRQEAGRCRCECMWTRSGQHSWSCPARGGSQEAGGQEGAVGDEQLNDAAGQHAEADGSCNGNNTSCGDGDGGDGFNVQGGSPKVQAAIMAAGARRRRRNRQQHSRGQGGLPLGLELGIVRHALLGASEADTRGTTGTLACHSQVSFKHDDKYKQWQHRPPRGTAAKQGGREPQQQLLMQQLRLHLWWQQQQQQAAHSCPGRLDSNGLPDRLGDLLGD